MVIIDSPGIAESEIMDEVVTHYLPEAFAFIYVINSANAGGVQRDRVSITFGFKVLARSITRSPEGSPDSAGD